MNKKLAEQFHMLTEELRKIIIHKNKIGELSRSEFSMLYLIIEHEKEFGAMTTSALSEKLGVSKPATSQMINGLEKKKYLERIIDKQDRRLICVALTELGKKTVAQVKKIHLEKMGIVLDRMGQEDSELFVNLLGKYVENVKAVILEKENAE